MKHVVVVLIPRFNPFIVMSWTACWTKRCVLRRRGRWLSVLACCVVCRRVMWRWCAASCGAETPTRGTGRVAPTPTSRRCQALPAVRARWVHNVPFSHHNVPSRHHNVTFSHHNVPSRHHNVPFSHHNVPSCHHNIPSRHHNVPFSHFNVPSPQRPIPSPQRPIPSRHRNIPSP